MKELKAQKLTYEAFRKYGQFQNLLDDADLAKNSIRPAGFFPDLIQLNFGTTTLPSVCVCSVKKQEKNIVGFMEYHAYTCEGLVTLDADVLIYVGIPGRNGMSIEDCEAFIVPKGYFVKLDPYVIHGSQYPIDTDTAHLICMLPQRTFNNDMNAHRIEKDEDKGIIVL